MRASPLLAALMAGSALCLAADGAAQDACDLLQSRSSAVQLTRDGFYNYISEPVFGCTGDVIIRADSAVLDDVSNYTRFIGNFEYRDSTALMTADRADHFAAEGRLIGVGNVHIVDGATGAVFEGDSTVLVGSSSRREGGELTIVGHDGRRAHAVILVSPTAAAPDSTETESDSAPPAADSAEAADSTATPVTDSAEAADSTATPLDPPETPAMAGDSALAADSAGAAAPGPGDQGEADPGQPPVDSLAASSDPAPDPPPRDTTPVPYDIDAEHIYLRGAGYLRATGSAELYNDDFRALADSIEYLEEAGKLFLRGTAPRVFGYGAEYVLSGDAVDLDMDGDQVAARGDAALSGSEIDLTAPEIRVLMRDGVLDRIVAMNEQPPEPELPGPPAGADTLAGDSAAAVAAAGEVSVDDPVTAAEDAPGDETAADAGPVSGEAAAGDARTEPVELAAGEAIPVGAEPAIEGTGAARATSDEPSDSAAAPPPPRPRAVARTFELEGDSIDVLAPGEVLDRVVAVGNARGESLARDSLNTEDTPEIARSDWVSGDTIIAVFRPSAAAATPEAGAEAVADEDGGGYQLDHLEARGQAASLYRMTPSGDSGEGEGEAEEEGEVEGGGEEAAPEVEAEQGPEEVVVDEDIAADPAQETAPEADPEALEATEEAAEEEAAPEAEPDNRLALHYVRGDLITIFMQDGEVTSVIVEGDARGIQLEPVAAPPPDTTAAPPVTRR